MSRGMISETEMRVNKGCVTKEESDVATIRLALLGDHEM